jgi:hypothetical protein
VPELLDHLCENDVSVGTCFRSHQAWVHPFLRTDVLRDFSGIAEVVHLDRQWTNRAVEAGFGQLKVVPISCIVVIVHEYDLKCFV